METRWFLFCRKELYDQTELLHEEDEKEQRRYTQRSAQEDELTGQFAVTAHVCSHRIGRGSNRRSKDCNEQEKLHAAQADSIAQQQEKQRRGILPSLQGIDQGVF